MSEYDKPFITIEQIEDALEERQLPDRRELKEAIAKEIAEDKRKKSDRRQAANQSTQ